MHEFIQFVMDHWMLWSLFAAIIVLLIQTEMSDQIAGVKLLSPQDMTNLTNREHAVLVDIREREQYDEGHITGAIHVNANQADWYQTTKPIKKSQDKPIVIICTQEQQAVSVAKQLKKADFKDVYVLKGGLTAWTQAKLPLVKAKS